MLEVIKPDILGRSVWMGNDFNSGEFGVTNPNGLVLEQDWREKRSQQRHSRPWTTLDLIGTSNGNSSSALLDRIGLPISANDLHFRILLAMARKINHDFCNLESLYSLTLLGTARCTMYTEIILQFYPRIWPNFYFLNTPPKKHFIW